MWRTMPRVFTVILLLAMAANYGCTLGERPFLMVQLCLEEERGLIEFKTVLQSIAQSEGMAYVDNSAQTRRELEAIFESDVDYPVINIAVRRRDGMGLAAGALKEFRNQVVVGFSEGTNPGEAQEFATRVIDRLEERWRVETVPAGQGAQPLKDCVNGTSNGAKSH